MTGSVGVVCCAKTLKENKLERVIPAKSMQDRAGRLNAIPVSHVDAAKGGLKRLKSLNMFSSHYHICPSPDIRFIQ